MADRAFARPVQSLDPRPPARNAHRLNATYPQNGAAMSSAGALSAATSKFAFFTADELYAPERRPGLILKAGCFAHPRGSSSSSPTSKARRARRAVARRPASFTLAGLCHLFHCQYP